MAAHMMNSEGIDLDQRDDIDESYEIDLEETNVLIIVSFSYLKQNFSLDVQQLKHIRKSVYFAQLKDGCQFIMKGFSARRSLLLQGAFTSSLKIHHFPYTYSFFS